jgi:hypothetical protein
MENQLEVFYDEGKRYRVPNRRATMDRKELMIDTSLLE